MKVLFLVVVTFAALCCAKRIVLSPAEAVAEINNGRIFDLSQTWDDTTPVWYGFPPPYSELMFDYPDGFRVDFMCHPGQDGTHVDPPAHFVPGLRTLDELQLDELILPLVILDVHEEVELNNDYEVTMSVVNYWERHHGKIPEGAFVALRTDWSLRWDGGMEAMENKDVSGISHTPGWSAEVLEYLYEEAGITASGHEMLDTDAGYVTTTTGLWPLEDYILRSNHYQVEVMAHLDQPDVSNCLAVVLVPRIEFGSGFPARVIAICPQDQQHVPHFKAAAKMMLEGDKFDLTHMYNENIPHWKGFDNTANRTTLFWYSDDGIVTPTIDYGFFAEQFCHVSQWGTHCDAPAHFHEGKKTLSTIAPEDMVSPLVVLNIAEKVAINHDYVVTMEDVRRWESKYGMRIPEGAFVALRSDWSMRWPSQSLMGNVDEDEIYHYPGWSAEVLTYLFETCQISACGHETTDTDPGLSTTLDDYSLESYVLYTDHYQIELLDNLAAPEENDCVVFAGWPKRNGGVGFSARVFAVCPYSD